MIPFPDKKYNIIYADPAWNYETWSEGASRNVKGKYKTMTPKEIFDLPVQDISEENCILFIWVTYPKLIEGIETIEQWGFKYKTCAFSWVKTNKSFAKDQSSFFQKIALKVFGEWVIGQGQIMKFVCLALKVNQKDVPNQFSK